MPGSSAPSRLLTRFLQSARILLRVRMSDLALVIDADLHQPRRLGIPSLAFVGQAQVPGIFAFNAAVADLAAGGQRLLVIADRLVRLPQFPIRILQIAQPVAFPAVVTDLVADGQRLLGASNGPWTSPSCRGDRRFRRLSSIPAHVTRWLSVRGPAESMLVCPQDEIPFQELAALLECSHSAILTLSRGPQLRAWSCASQASLAPVCHRHRRGRSMVHPLMVFTCSILPARCFGFVTFGNTVEARHEYAIAGSTRWPVGARPRRQRAHS
jgi:hypothetical protein